MGTPELYAEVIIPSFFALLERSLPRRRKNSLVVVGRLGRVLAKFKIYLSDSWNSSSAAKTSYMRSMPASLSSLSSILWVPCQWKLPAVSCMSWKRFAPVETRQSMYLFFMRYTTTSRIPAGTMAPASPKKTVVLFLSISSHTSTAVERFLPWKAVSPILLTRPEIFPRVSIFTGLTAFLRFLLLFLLSNSIIHKSFLLFFPTNLFQRRPESGFLLSQKLYLTAAHVLDPQAQAL